MRDGPWLVRVGLMRVVACVAALCLSLVFAGTVAASAKYEDLKKFQVALTWAKHSRAVRQGLAAAPSSIPASHDESFLGSVPTKARAEEGRGRVDLSQGDRRLPGQDHASATRVDIRRRRQYRGEAQVPRHHANSPRDPLLDAVRKVGNVGSSLGTGDVPRIQGASLPVVLTKGRVAYRRQIPLIPSCQIASLNRRSAPSTCRVRELPPRADHMAPGAGHHVDRLGVGESGDLLDRPGVEVTGGRVSHVPFYQPDGRASTLRVVIRTPVTY